MLVLSELLTSVKVSRWILEFLCGIVESVESVKKFGSVPYDRLPIVHND